MVNSAGLSKRFLQYAGMYREMKIIQLTEWLPSRNWRDLHKHQPGTPVDIAAIYPSRQTLGILAVRSYIYCWSLCSRASAVNACAFALLTLAARIWPCINEVGAQRVLNHFRNADHLGTTVVKRFIQRITFRSSSIWQCFRRRVSNWLKSQQQEHGAFT